MGRIIILLLSLLHYASSEKCYALAMEGGGMCGAYESGALTALTELLPASLLEYQFIGGISIGSYNVCWCSGFALGDERNMSLYLKDVWLSVNKTSQVFSYRLPLLRALFWSPALTDNTAALNLIKEKSGNTIRRNVTVGATNINTGELVNFDQSIESTDLHTACWASGAYPVAFPPVYFMEEYFIDGCATANLDAFSVINKCRELGYRDRNIVVDLLYDVHPRKLPQNRINKTSQAIGKIISIKNYYKEQWFISQLENDFPYVDFRYKISPSKALHNYAFIHPEDLKFKIDLGYNDTRLLLKMTKSQREKEFKKNFKIDPHFR